MAVMFIVPCLVRQGLGDLFCTGWECCTTKGDSKEQQLLQEVQRIDAGQLTRQQHFATNDDSNGTQHGILYL